MRVKDTYLLRVWDDENPDFQAIGECNLFKGLSLDDVPQYEEVLSEACASGLRELPPYSSIIFGAETALANLHCGKPWMCYPSAWTEGEIGIRINGLVWMGSKSRMIERIKEKLNAGFRCIKIKIGAINFEDEIDLLSFIRRHFSADSLELRLDANGAFSPHDALERIMRLEPFSIHSLEQPIRAGQWEQMERICRLSPIPIALDEELIGVRNMAEKSAMLEKIKPQYIILKPALCGGFAHADQWIDIAKKMSIGWWATSALESNIGRNAIAQWLTCRHPEALGMPQGLGTGLLYANNYPSPIEHKGESLWFNPKL